MTSPLSPRPPQPIHTPRRVETLGFANAQILDITGPMQVFASANDLAAAAGRPAPYALQLVAAAGPVQTSAGLVLDAAPLPSPDAAVDTLILAGGFGVTAACDDAALVAWVAARARAARRVASVCSGAFLLAEAGLLDGRRAVTHWQRCAEFAARFPRVRLDPDPIFIRDGAVWTSAGITAGIDLALALVEEDLGRRTALAVARQLVVFLKRPGGQAQFSATLTLQTATNPATANPAVTGRFDALHAWIADNLRGDLSLTALAARAAMSARSFSRHYRQATGQTPARAVETIRVEAARRMLEQGASVAQTAARCGFGGEDTLRRSFLRRVGTSPQSYRERF
ncbi:GlxA family transcriptional regulator [Azospirillum griseum]|uniref:Helix-turn-helix domain-containing protein n=1 Tax=Azospirillum griseum TaxID=2496639 RepID=A0A431VGP0_9PROT|nr:helix-turn-helix domain-containing protein [Azospirillum griseum]RTR19528.1 helix-turn-helix domain-containing protein [Azospirillum griseum]